MCTKNDIAFLKNNYYNKLMDMLSTNLSESQIESIELQTILKLIDAQYIQVGTRFIIKEPSAVGTYYIQYTIHIFGKTIF